jgi:hypothetical protein
MEFTQIDAFLPAFVISFAFKLVMAGIGYYFVRGILRHLDKIIDFNFKEWIANADDNAKATYLAARILAISIFIAWIVS